MKRYARCCIPAQNASHTDAPAKGFLGLAVESAIAYEHAGLLLYDVIGCGKFCSCTLCERASLSVGVEPQVDISLYQRMETSHDARQRQLRLMLPAVTPARARSSAVRTSSTALGA